MELRGKRITVRRRGRAAAILVPATDDEHAAMIAATARRRLAAAAGAWEEHPDVDPDEQATTAVTAGELVYGAWCSSRPEHFLAALRDRVWPNIRVPDLRVEDWLADYR